MKRNEGFHCRQTCPCGARSVLTRFLFSISEKGQLGHQSQSDHFFSVLNRQLVRQVTKYVLCSNNVTQEQNQHSEHDFHNTTFHYQDGSSSNKAPRAISQQPVQGSQSQLNFSRWKMLLLQKVNLLGTVLLLAYLFTQNSEERVVFIVLEDRMKSVLLTSDTHLENDVVK